MQAIKACKKIPEGFASTVHLVSNHTCWPACPKSIAQPSTSLAVPIHHTKQSYDYFYSRKQVPGGCQQKTKVLCREPTVSLSPGTTGVGTSAPPEFQATGTGQGSFFNPAEKKKTGAHGVVSLDSSSCSRGSFILRRRGTVSKHLTIPTMRSKLSRSAGCRGRDPPPSITPLFAAAACVERVKKVPENGGF